MSDKLLDLKRKPKIFTKPMKVSTQKNTVPTLKKLSNKQSPSDRIEELEQQISLLTSYSSDTVYRLNYKSMKYDYISPAVAKLLGFTPMEMQRINFRSLIEETKIVTDGLKKVKSYEEFEEIRRKGDVGIWQADYLIRQKSGEKIWVSDISHPWFDEKGSVIGSVGSLRNITDRVRVEQQILGDFENMSVTDPLTGLAGKSEFFSELEYEVKRAKRTSEEFSLVIFDIDGLGKLNDQFGKDIGDEIIIKFSAILTETLRDTDTISRTGGGSFAAILPDTNIKGSYYLAERVRKEVSKKNFVVSGDRTSIGFSVSAGTSTYEQGDSLTSTDLFKLADTRLYIAKNTGKNLIAQDELAQMH